MDLIEPEHIRREALGAFVHEVRTPLTSIRMVLEVARRMSGGENLVLDGELTAMMETSLADLQTLADALHELSRLERGRLALRGETADLGELVRGLGEHNGVSLHPQGEPWPKMPGAWDRERLTVAMRGMAEGANRCGAGSGNVAVRAQIREPWCEVHFESGTPGGSARPIDGDLGYSFYRGCALVTAMDGSVGARREDGYLGLRVHLPATGITR